MKEEEEEERERKDGLKRDLDKDHVP